MRLQDHFADALLIAAAKQERYLGVEKFIEAYRIRPYDWKR